MLPSEVALLRVRRLRGSPAAAPGAHVKAGLLTSIEVDDGAALDDALRSVATAKYVAIAAEEDHDSHVIEGARRLDDDPAADLVWFDTVIERTDTRGVVFEPWPATEHGDVRRELLVGAPLPLGAVVLRRAAAERVARSAALQSFRSAGAHRAALLGAFAHGGRAVRGPGWAYVGCADGAGAWRPGPSQAADTLVRRAFEEVRQVDARLEPFERLLLGQSWRAHELAPLRTIEHTLREVAVVAPGGARVPLDGPACAVAIRLTRHRAALSGVSLDVMRRTLWFEFGWNREGMPVLAQALESLVGSKFIVPMANR